MHWVVIVSEISFRVYKNRWEKYTVRGMNTRVKREYNPAILHLSQGTYLINSIRSLLTHSEWRPQHIYSWAEKTLYFIIKLATQIPLFSLKISKTRCFVSAKLNMNILAIRPDLKNCQFAPRIVMFNLSMCCQFEVSQIISPKIIPMSHQNI